MPTYDVDSILWHSPDVLLLLTAIYNLLISLYILKLVSEIEELFVQSDGTKCALLAEATLYQLIYRVCLSYFNLLFSIYLLIYLVVYLSIYLCYSIAKLFTCHCIINMIESVHSPLPHQRSRFLLPMVAYVLENLLYPKRPSRLGINYLLLRRNAVRFQFPLILKWINQLWVTEHIWGVKVDGKWGGKLVTNPNNKVIIYYTEMLVRNIKRKLTQSLYLMAFWWCVICTAPWPNG